MNTNRLRLNSKIEFESPYPLNSCVRMLKEASDGMTVEIESESPTRKTFVIRKDMKQELIGRLQELPANGTYVQAYVYLNALGFLVVPLIIIFVAVAALIIWPHAPDGTWLGVVLLGIVTAVGQIYRFWNSSQRLTTFLISTLGTSE